MTVYEWLLILGVPSIIVSVTQIIVTYVKNGVSTGKLLRLAIQALLRDRLIQLHDLYMEQGWVSIPKKENFENLYKQYHGLGKNGVMDESYNDIMKLPTTEAQKKD